MTDPDQPRTDPVVDRVNELITTLMDAAGVLLLVGAAGYGAWALWGRGWALLVGGVVMIVLSTFAQARSRGRAPAPLTAEQMEIPGPSHPGTVHIAGGR